MQVLTLELRFESLDAFERAGRKSPASRLLLDAPFRAGDAGHGHVALRRPGCRSPGAGHSRRELIDDFSTDQTTLVLTPGDPSCGRAMRSATGAAYERRGADLAAILHRGASLLRRLILPLEPRMGESSRTRAGLKPPILVRCWLAGRKCVLRSTRPPTVEYLWPGPQEP